MLRIRYKGGVRDKEEEKEDEMRLERQESLGDQMIQLEISISFPTTG